MIVDLVSPWAAAIGAVDSVGARRLFRERHHLLLEPLRRARTPAQPALPLADAGDRLRQLARRAADPAMQQQIRDALAAAAALGADQCQRVLLLAGDETGDAAEPIPWPDADVALFLDRIDDDGQLIVVLARAVAALTRWRAPDSRTLVSRNAEHQWDRWQLLRDVPLREWIYTDGVALHLAHALQPDQLPHQLLGMTSTGFNRVRQRENVLRDLLASDLEERGIGLILRWLTPDAPAGPRTVGAVVLPPMAGRYLAWRLVADRVARAGLRDAIRMEA